MVERVILGKRGADTGLWVSVPGKSASSTTYEDLMIDTTRTTLQPMLSGIISKPSLTYRRGNNSSGYYAEYYDDFYYKSDKSSLGYIPICHFSIGSNIAGEIYPTIKIDATKVRLYHLENWEQNIVVEHYLAYKLIWDNGYKYVPDKWDTRYKYTDAGKPSSISYSCDIHYTIYAQASGLT